MMSTRFERARLLTTSAEADAALVDSSYRWRTATGGRTRRSGSDDAIRRSRSCVRGEFLRVASDRVLALNSRRTGIRWTRGDGCWAHKRGRTSLAHWLSGIGVSALGARASLSSSLSLPERRWIWCLSSHLTRPFR
jgi:hypothetical protein